MFPVAAAGLALVFASAATVVHSNPLPLSHLPGPTESSWTSRSLTLDTAATLDAVFAHNSTEHGKRQSWTLTQPGTTGVLAMQLAVVSPTQLLIIDRVQQNPLKVDGHSAWASIYSLTFNTARPVRLQSNSFCAGTGYLSNGTLVNVGGFSAEGAVRGGIPDANGLQALRQFEPSSCPDNKNGGPCAMIEFPTRMRLATPRWYPSVLRLGDGSLMIIGGANAAPFMNNATLNVPSIEYYPPKRIGSFNGVPVPSPFLQQTLNANLFPIAILLPGGKVFLAANTRAMIYDWELNVEQRLPDIPDVRISYPLTGTGVLLPLSASNGWTPTVLICGGQARSDTVAPSQMSAQDAASSQCATIELSVSGIARGWQVENMPEGRVMPDAVLLPDGRVMIVNGAKSGYAGYGNVQGQVGKSNADNPVLRPVIYDYSAPKGSRFSTQGMPTSSIARMYHSTATLLPSGQVAIAGSNPNGDYSAAKYATEYRLELLSPPYMNQARPTFSGVPKRADYGSWLWLSIKLPKGANKVRVALMDLGFSTHSVHMSNRLVWLQTMRFGNMLVVILPPSKTIYPPGPGWLYVLADGVASQGTPILVGSGKGPTVDQNALANMLATTGKV